MIRRLLYVVALLALPAYGATPAHADMPPFGDSATSAPSQSATPPPVPRVGAKPLGSSTTAVIPPNYLYNGSNGLTVGTLPGRACYLGDPWYRLPAYNATDDYFGWYNSCGIAYAALACVDWWYNSGGLGWTFSGRTQLSAAHPQAAVDSGWNWKYAVHPNTTCP